MKPLFRIPKSSYVSEEDSIGDNPVSRLHEFLQSHGFDRNHFLMHFCMYRTERCFRISAANYCLKVHERPSFDDDQFGNFFEVRCGIVQLQMETCARRMYL